ncbi:MAG: SDR family oxidoreductase [Candidatus Omnitrophota bacterium]|nr:SDR family oxidoreductase [Candidatus Omnitrophota bacterium]
MKTAVRSQYEVGQVFRTSIDVDQKLVERFADFSGDRNPLHMDAGEAQSYGYARRVAHGGILIAFLSKLIGMEIPGPGAVWMNQQVDWTSPVFVGDVVELAVTVEKISTGAGMLTLDVTAANQKGKTVMKGKANVKVAEKIEQKSAQKKSVKTALVTGSGRGIGAEIARKLAASGVKVIVNCRKSVHEAEGVQQEIRALGGTAEVMQADLSDYAQTEAMIDSIIKQFGSLDIVVHGASPMVTPAMADQVTQERLDHFFRAYVGGARSLVAKAAPAMAERKFGRFIFLGTSFMFGIPPAGMSAYVTAKEALWGYVKCLAADLGPSGITSNMVSPSMTVTDFTADIPARMKELEARKSPMRRMASVADTAAAVVFLAGEDASYINGSNLPVTGGPI